MQPDFHLTEPKPGDKITALRETNMVKAVKALQPSVGFGMMISRNNNGVMYSVKKGEVTGVASRTKMPFDCQLVSQEPDSAVIEVHVLNGKLFYGAGNSLVDIPATDLVGMDYWDIEVGLADGLMLGVQCIYDSEGSASSDSSVPVSFTVAAIPDDVELMDAQGLKYYPLVRFVKVTSDQTYDGPYIFTVQVPVEPEGGAGEGEGEGEGDDEEQEYDTYYAVQCYHGDIVFDNNDYSPWVGVVQSGGDGGTYSVTAADGSGQSTGTIHFVEIAGAATFPHGSRVIVHRIIVPSLASGEISSGS